MAIQLYMDHHVPGAVTDGVRLHGVDVVTARENDAHLYPDPELMSRATQLGRVLVSLDEDLLGEAARRQRGGIPFSGLIYAHQLRIRIGQFVEDLLVVCEACEPADLQNTTIFLPL